MKESDLSKAHAILNDDSGYLKEKYAQDERNDEHLRRTALWQMSKRLMEIDKAAWELVYAQGRMLEQWAESSPEKAEQLWKNLHEKGGALRELLENEG